MSVKICTLLTFPPKFEQTDDVTAFKRKYNFSMLNYCFMHSQIVCIIFPSKAATSTSWIRLQIRPKFDDK